MSLVKHNYMTYKYIQVQQRPTSFHFSFVLSFLVRVVVQVQVQRPSSFQFRSFFSCLGRFTCTTTISFVLSFLVRVIVSVSFILFLSRSFSFVHSFLVQVVVQLQVQRPSSFQFRFFVLVLTINHEKKS